MLNLRRRNKYWKVTYIDVRGREQVRYYSAFRKTEAERRLDTVSSVNRIVKTEEVSNDVFLKNKENHFQKSSGK